MVTQRIAAMLLAGGLARRMGGGDKGLKELAGRPLMDHVLDRLKGQDGAVVDPVFINANGDPGRFAPWGLPVVPDVVEGAQGPLAGILTGLLWLREHRPDVPWLLTAPVDGPFLPLDLAARLFEAVAGDNGAEDNGADDRADLACVASGGRATPVVGLWPVALADDLKAAVIGEEIRKVDIWTARHRLSVVEFSDDPVDPFFNANRPDDLAEAERLLGLLES
ncbi:MAG: molybdenum cofactor guanylyltransferase MobA [Alphaproteobacteria bacterium]|nr:molybdenum cofactor guanylyltransferase MobA [Alphaproteobacteria bacterium]